MNAIYIFAAVWVSVPLAGLLLSKLFNITSARRCLFFYLASILALVPAAVLLSDPYNIVMSTIDPTFYSLFNTGNSAWFRVNAGIYAVLGVVLFIALYLRPSLPPLPVAAQFWLLHIGVLVKTLPFIIWVVKQGDGPIDIAKGAGEWAGTAQTGDWMIYLSFAAMAVFLLWALLTRARTAKS
jgi:hypothetical protein